MDFKRVNVCQTKERKRVSSRSLHKLRDDVPPCQPERPYVFEGVDQGGRWYNGSATRTAFSSTCVNSPSITATLSANGGDGQTDRVVQHPHDNPPAGGSARSLAYATKQQLHDTRRRREFVKTPVESFKHLHHLQILSRWSTDLPSRAFIKFKTFDWTWIENDDVHVENFSPQIATFSQFLLIF